MAAPSKSAHMESKKNISMVNEFDSNFESNDKTAREPGANSDPDKTAREPASDREAEIKEIRKADARNKVKECSFYNKGGLEEFDYTMLKKP